MYIVFDIGGTNTRIAWSRDGESFADPLIEKTIHHPTHGPQHLIDSIETVAQGRPIGAIAGGIAGTLDEHHLSLENSPNLSSWEQYPLAATLSQHFSCPVHLENDSAMVALGEAHYGAGADHKIVTYITVSTGVGGARIIDGHIDANRYGFEPGHQILDIETGATLEMLVSGKANEERFQTEITKLPAETWPKLARQLAIGLHNISLLWSSDVVVLGGSMITKPIGIKITDVQQALTELPQIQRPGPEIIQSNLDAVGGLYGSLIVARTL